MVLAANGPDLATVALRPHLIWGPGDNHLIPRIVARARAGRLRRIGRRPNLVDSIYIDNAADAHLLAADRLGARLARRRPGVLPLAGRALAALGPDQRHPPRRGAPAGRRGRSRPPSPGLAGAALEAAHRVFRLPGEPTMTRFLAHQLSTAHWFNIDAARRDLGYRPAVSIDEGLRRLGDGSPRPDRGRPVVESSEDAYLRPNRMVISGRGVESRRPPSSSLVSS